MQFMFDVSSSALVSHEAFRLHTTYSRDPSQPTTSATMFNDYLFYMVPYEARSIPTPSY